MLDRRGCERKRHQIQTRFSRIRAGKIRREDFQAWAEKARDLRDLIMRGEMTLEEYEAWLKSGRWV